MIGGEVGSKVTQGGGEGHQFQSRNEHDKNLSVTQVFLHCLIHTEGQRKEEEDGEEDEEEGGGRKGVPFVVPHQRKGIRT